MPDPENGNVQVVVRRRRTRRHRRNRLIRRLFAMGTLAVLTAAASTSALRYFGASHYARQADSFASEQSELQRDREVALNQIFSQSHPQPPRPVYPYSVVPGGINDAKELKWVAEHDPIVAAHYAGFDYNHARVVQLTLARTVYMSYRIGNNVYWMRRRITLHKGEKLITDGRMTARGRCANRVEETPQQAASPAEPSPEKFDEPVMAGGGTTMQGPKFPFASTLLPQMSGYDPAGPLSLSSPFEGGSWIPISPPALPAGLCGPAKKGNTATAEVTGTNGKKKVGSCGAGLPIGTVPEPGTWVLLMTGSAALWWQARRKLAHA
ncbi:MAG: PEP-CTERM sorting domain-containing protein [Candidatus Sulfotelmatobacter sp.]